MFLAAQAFQFENHGARSDLFHRRPAQIVFEHQIITFLTRKGMISPKLQLLSGHTEEKSLAIYRDLALTDVWPEYEEAMRTLSGAVGNRSVGSASNSAR